MTSNREAEIQEQMELWKLHASHRAAIREAYGWRIQQHHQMANDTTKLMMNVLFILNGGGILALPAMQVLLPKTDLSSAALSVPGCIFLFGLLFGLLAGIFTVWNFRLHGVAAELLQNAELLDATEREAAQTDDVEFIASKELEAHKTFAAEYGSQTILWTFRFGWGFAILSAIAFVYGAVSLGGELNPLCRAIDVLRLCASA